MRCLSRVLLLLSLSAPLAHADIYKCPDGQGGTIYRNQPCGDVSPLLETPASDQAQQPTRPDFHPDLTRLQALVQAWQDTMRVVSATPRIALSGPLRDLYRIRAETQATPVVPCLQEAKTLLLRGMGDSLQAIQRFAQYGDTPAHFEQDKLDDAQVWFKRAQEHVKACQGR